jgi:hypothetical protein
MPDYIPSIVNNIQLFIYTIRENYKGADDWDSIGPDGNFLPGTKAKGAGEDIGGQPADKVWIEYQIFWTEPANSKSYSVPGDTPNFRNYIKTNDPNFFNNVILEVANAADSLRPDFKGTVTDAGLNGFQNYAAVSNIVDVEAISSWSTALTTWGPAANGSNDGGRGEAGSIQGPSPIERTIPGTDTKEWFVWAAFRVRPQVIGTAEEAQANGSKDINFIGDPKPLNYGFLLHKLTEGQYKVWNSLGNNSKFNDPSAVVPDNAADPETEIPDTYVNMSRLLTNLPMNKYARKNSEYSGGPKWRKGLIHTWEGTPSFDKGSFSTGVPYGFRFHWNPSSWSQSATMATAINIESIMDSNPIGYVRPDGFSTISLRIQLNRLYDLQSSGGPPLDPSQDAVITERAKELLFGRQGSQYVYPVQADSGVPSGFDRYGNSFGVLDDVKRLLRMGTLYDLDYLFAATNGRGAGSHHVHYTPKTGGSDLYNPSYPQTQTEQSKINPGIPDRNSPNGSPDPGFISANYVRIWLGPYITFVGRITNYNMSHVMFTEYMVPVVTQVDLSITRVVTLGPSLEYTDIEKVEDVPVTPTTDPNATDSK